MPTDVILDTERLKLRPLAQGDLELLDHLRHDPEMMRYMSDGHIPDKAETQSWLQWHVDLWDMEGFSLFAVKKKADGRFIGWTGVTRPHWFPEMMPTPEIGWLSQESCGARASHLRQRLQLRSLPFMT